MIKEEKLLWDKISHFKIDDKNSDFTFSKRLARENNWSLEYSKRVIDEYKKFIFLCCVTKTGVTPSDQVDQAWHLHLTYTKSYWIDFCKNTLEKEIHHNPTKGGKTEAVKFDDFYSKTKEDYNTYFKEEPPIEIWPNNENRFSEIDFKRVNTQKNWIIKKPTLSERNKYLTGFFLLVSIFLIQARSLDNDSIITILFLIVIAIMAYYSNKNKKGGSGCSSGCSSGSGHHGCSGDSGCSSSGCSGCGGGCGGGD
ncbi:MAG: hypothetical protein V4666_12405 [Bacteroidota bacterium]